MILIDLTQVIISNCVVHLSKDLKGDNPEAKNLIKHSLLSSILSYKRQYGKEYGKIVLASDSKTYWRRDYFPPYKGHRKHDRETSKLNWDIIFEAISEIKAELKEYFPYTMLEVDGAEADDIIAVLTEHLQDHETIKMGLFEDEPQKIMILSADGDFVQLQKFLNVKQWSPIQKKLVKPKGKIHDYLIEHICTGDAGDGIPNILTSDQWSIDRMNNDKPVRQTPFKKARLTEFILIGEKACKNEEEKRNWIRNRTLIDFSYIPDDIYNRIIDAYNKYEVKGNKTKLMNYFIKNKMKLLFASIGDF